MSETVLITGAGGFIGSHLIPQLVRADYNVIAIDNNITKLTNLNVDCNKVEIDITNRESMGKFAERLNIDSVVHLAAIAAPRYAEEHPDLTFNVNVQGTYAVLKLAKSVGAQKTIFMSSAHVYGISPKYMPTDESHPLYLLDTYTTSKVLGEQLCQLFYENHSLSYMALRLFNGYGPNQSVGYFIPDMVEKAKKGDITLQGGYVTKDFVYIDDIVGAIIKSLNSKYVGPLNVGTGVQTTLESVALRIGESFGVKVNCVKTSDKGPTHMQADTTRMITTLGWKPQISVDEGLGRVIEAAKS